MYTKYIYRERELESANYEVNEEKIGESVMAFADFLTYPMRSETSKWMKRAVVVSSDLPA